MEAPFQSAFQKDVDALPPLLRALLDAELAAGNEIIEISHGHPAPPIGACVMLARPVTTRRRGSGDGIAFRESNSSLHGGSYTDRDFNFYILEAPLPPPEPPDMDAIREASNKPRPNAVITSGNELVDRFRKGMHVDFEMWHDGIGYKLDMLNEATDVEKEMIVPMLIPPQGWRDVEALATLDTDSAGNY